MLFDCRPLLLIYFYEDKGFSKNQNFTWFRHKYPPNSLFLHYNYLKRLYTHMYVFLHVHKYILNSENTVPGNHIKSQGRQ